MMKITAWGKSMYGGWYANTIEVEVDDTIINHDGVRFSKLSELRSWAKGAKVELANYKRWDN